MHPTLLAAAIALSFTPVVLAASDAAPPPAEVTVIHCGHLIDVDAGKLLGESTIVIEGKRIKEVRAGHADIAGATKMTDLPMSTCLPGLIDSHVHLTMEFSPDRLQ